MFLIGEKTDMKKEDQARSLFGISLTDRPTWQQFLICSSGFFFRYLVNGICEEQHGSGLILIAMGIMPKLLPDSKLPSRAAVCDASDMQKPLENKDREDEEKRQLI